MVTSYTSKTESFLLQDSEHVWRNLLFNVLIFLVTVKHHTSMKSLKICVSTRMWNDNFLQNVCTKEFLLLSRQIYCTPELILFVQVDKVRKSDYNKEISFTSLSYVISITVNFPTSVNLQRNRIIQLNGYHW